MKKDKLLAVDLLRIAATMMVFFFHINLHFGFRTTIGWLDTIFSVGANFMVCFIMMSGFILAYIYDVKSIKHARGRSLFYRKRLKHIYPSYLFFFFIAILFRLSFPETTKQLLLLIPVDILMLQAHFPESFSFLGNDGTWFISVIIFLYFLFPFLLQLLDEYREHTRSIIVFLYLLSILNGILRVFLGGKFASYYAAPILRVPEFMIGMAVGCLFRRRKTENTIHFPLLFHIGLCVIIPVIYCVCVVLLFPVKVFGTDFFARNYLSYNFLLIPCFAILIYSLACLEINRLPGIMEKGVSFLSRLSFPFYLTQTIANRLTAELISSNALCNFVEGSWSLMMTAFLLNLIFAVFMYFCQLFIEKYLK